MNSVLFSHQSDEWETPWDLFEFLQSQFHFTLDAAASKLNTKLERFFSIENSALNNSWKNEIVFCNPPFSLIQDFVSKAFHEHIVHHVQIAMLLPVRTDTKWFLEISLTHICSIHFFHSRLHFSNSKNPAPFPCMLVLWGFDKIGDLDLWRKI